MTTERKVELVQSARADFGLTPALAALSLPRSTWHYWFSQRQSYEEKYADLKAPLEQIAREHPEYGYRRTSTELQEVYEQAVGEEVVRKLHRLWELSLRRTVKPPKPSAIRQIVTEAGDRCNLVARLDEILPFEVLYTDFTELAYATGKAYLIPLLGHVTKLVFGWAVGPAPTTDLALAAWSMAVEELSRWGRTPAGVIVHHDRDPVFTSHRWLDQLLVQDQACVSYALRGAKDNPEMESFNSRFKNENRSLLQEAGDLEELIAVVRDRIVYHNRERRHSSLGNRSPWSFAATLDKEP